MNSLRCLFKTKKKEKDVNKSFTIFDLIYQLILNNETIQPIIHKKSISPKMNVKKTTVYEWDFFFFLYV